MYKILISTIIIVYFSGCKKTVNDFVFIYSMESVGNYKAECIFYSDKSYVIKENNYLFDKMEDKKVITKTGVLTDTEFNTIKGLIENSDIPSLKDSYSFDLQTDILYQVCLETDGNDKFVLMKDIDKSLLPPAFVKLITYCNSFISKNKN